VSAPGDASDASPRTARTPAWPAAAHTIPAATLLLAIIAWTSWISLRPTPPAPADAAGFSAIRALAAARAVLGEAPRPTQSPADADAIERLKRHLTDLGLEPQEQRATVRVPNRGAVTLRNVMVRREGRQRLPAIVLVAHHDTVADAPGGGDDGMGVAVCLEAARLLAQESTQRPVIILFTDGEETGLLGARLFAQSHPWAADIAAVVNVDNRGDDGPALLFETGPGDLDLIRAIASRAAHPVANSVFAEIYRRMPNGSDLTVFLERGVTGVNFACIDGLARYHQPTDTFDAVNLASLQHEGDMAMAAVRGLGDMTAAPGARRAVFVDLFGRCLLVWPDSVGLALAIAAAAGIVAFGFHASRRTQSAALHGRTAMQQVRGATAAAVVLLATAAAVWLAHWSAERLGWFGMRYAESLAASNRSADKPNRLALWVAAYWPAHGVVVAIALTALCVPAAFAGARWLLPRGSPWNGWAGAWTVLAVVNILATLLAPGASAVLLPATLTAAVAAWGGALLFGVHAAATAWLALLAPIAMSGVVLAPIEWLAWPAIGLSMSGLHAALSGLYAVQLMTLCVPRGADAAHAADPGGGADAPALGVPSQH
jgi:hypothetical protein